MAAAPSTPVKQPNLKGKRVSKPQGLKQPSDGGRPVDAGFAHDERPARLLLEWYDLQGRELPWRVKPSAAKRAKSKTVKRQDPYAVWLSEVMLQQTTVKAVAPFFQKFLKLWPKVSDLAAADEEDVLRAWAGLGYYSRARNLHACARAIMNDFDGAFPADEAKLLTLPGVGPYTAAAIAAIAFDLPASPVDGNIERVVTRLFKIETPLPKSKPEIKQRAIALTPTARTGDYAQAMMDLGATICTPKRPYCMLCPLSSCCLAEANGVAAQLPYREAKKAKPVRRGVAFFAMRETGEVLLRKRPARGLLASMIEVPSTLWSAEFDPDDEPLRDVPMKASWVEVPGVVQHTFTHFKLELTLYQAVVRKNADVLLWAEPDRCRWVHRDALADEALPSVMRKVIAHALG